MLTLQFQAGETYGFSGELGAGKTTLVQMIGKELGIQGAMTSPTFVFRKEYEVSGRAYTKLVHIDAYRVEGGDAEDLGVLDEMDAVTLIEWPEKIQHVLPAGTKNIRITINPDESRTLIVE